MALLTGNTAVITGGASGIGLATASRFVDEGAQEPADATHVMRRSSSQDAGQLPVTAHDIAMAAAEDSLPAPTPRRSRAPSGGNSLPHNQLRALARRGKHTRYCDKRDLAGAIWALVARSTMESIYSQAGVWRASEQRCTSVHATTTRCAPVLATRCSRAPRPNFATRARPTPRRER